MTGAQRLVGDDQGIRPCAYSGTASMLDTTTIPRTSFVREADWATVGGYPEQLSMGEDWAFWMRLFRLGGEVRAIPEITHDYRLSPQQATVNPDPIAAVEAQNLVLRENAELYPREMLVELAARNRSEAVHLRRKHGRIDSTRQELKRWLTRR